MQLNKMQLNKKQLINLSNVEINFRENMSTVASSAANRTQKHQEKNSWHRRELNPRLLGEKQVCHLCAMNKKLFERPSSQLHPTKRPKSRSGTGPSLAQGIRPVQICPICLIETQSVVPYSWGLGFGLARLISSLGDVLGVVGKKALKATKEGLRPHLRNATCRRGKSGKTSRPFFRVPGLPELAPASSSGGGSSTPCPPRERRTRSKTESCQMKVRIVAGIG